LLKTIKHGKITKNSTKITLYIDEKARRRAFCTCGLSSKNPYCDESHKGTGFSPKIIELEEEKEVVQVWL